jgi:hypothetical protein
MDIVAGIGGVIAIFAAGFGMGYLAGWRGYERRIRAAAREGKTLWESVFGRGQKEDADDESFEDKFKTGAF